MYLLSEMPLFRLMAPRSGEVAYIKFGLSGLKAEIEFPSDWHEYRRAWVRLGFGLFKLAFSFPWSKVVPDDGQCSGPQYGFCFFSDGLHLHWGKMKSGRGSPFAIINMPWHWRHVRQGILTPYEKHRYVYRLKSGEVQERTATIRAESRTWWRPWPPFVKLSRYIDIEFDAEVGERSGSWKGGCLGCSYEMRRGERPVDTLKRMEQERKF